LFELWNAVLPNFLKEHPKGPDHNGPKELIKLEDFLPELTKWMLHKLTADILYWYELQEIKVEDIKDCLMKLGYKIRKRAKIDRCNVLPGSGWWWWGKCSFMHSSFFKSGLLSHSSGFNVN